MKSLSKYVNEKLGNQEASVNEAKIGQKDFKSIKVGDIAIHDDGDKAGKILWKGSLKELKSSKYKYLTNDFDEDDLPEDYDWVVVDGGHIEGPTLMNYMADPSGVHVNEAFINEEDITSDEQFKEYGKEVLKNAHGEDYDEETANDTLQGILDDSDGDYGEAVGKLQSSLGESLNENAKMTLWEFYDSNIDHSKNETAFIKLEIKSGFNQSDVESILGDVEQGLSDDELKTYYSKIKNK